ncbi:MAG: hypothetical protein FWC89_09620 [Defluviitaleaceae bacterium]|nr:hypothetical protein [Defluviitaleaceae bacterium]
MDKELILQKYGLIHENGAWYSDKENSHKHLIVKDAFLEKTDTLGLLFRITKLCMAKVNYFRKNINNFEPCKYHYKDGFVSVPLWDAEFLKHKASGFVLDFDFLLSITVYEDFVALYEELETYEQK